MIFDAVQARRLLERRAGLDRDAAEREVQVAARRISARSNSSPIVCDGGSSPACSGGPVSIFSGCTEKSTTGVPSLEPLTSTVRSVTVKSKPLPTPTTPTLAACARSAS